MSVKRKIILGTYIVWSLNFKMDFKESKHINKENNQPSSIFVGRFLLLGINYYSNFHTSINIYHISTLRVSRGLIIHISDTVFLYEYTLFITVESFTVPLCLLWIVCMPYYCLKSCFTTPTLNELLLTIMWVCCM